MTRLPALGPRGEGWVLIQLVLLAAIAAGGLVGPAWSGDLRVAGVAVGVVLAGIGGWLAVRAIVDLRSALTPLPYPRPEAELVERGAYRLVRHPIYGGLILGAVGWGLAWASPLALGLAVALFGFFSLKSRREEAWLAERFPGYAAYRGRTRRLIPFVY